MQNRLFLDQVWSSRFPHSGDRSYFGELAWAYPTKPMAVLTRPVLGTAFTNPAPIRRAYPEECPGLR